MVGNRLYEGHQIDHTEFSARTEGRSPEETAMNILSKARSWMKSRQTAQELANLSNETLADIGLTRFDIDNVARGLRTR